MTIPTKQITNMNKKVNNKTDIWDNTNHTEERQKIRDFWIHLSEEERRSLVRIEKETVLRRMKEQQKHTCNCSVCGKKSSVIEEELEVLYDAYYEELESYAYRQQQQKRLQSLEDSGSDEEVNIKIKNTLAVKDNVITLADDLMKNDGRKFLEMMEKITDQKLKRERELQSEDEDDVYEDELEEEEEEEEEEEDLYDEEEEEDTVKTNEQKMEEGKKMFQVFAARMFEQRVMQAYREKVAQDRQKRLIEELEEEDRLRQERELKKQREREKKKETKRLEKLKQEQERIKLEAERKQEEEEKQRKLKELQEQERKRKEEERKQRESERQRKEAERQRREEERKKKELEEIEKIKKEKEEKKKKEQDIRRKKEQMIRETEAKKLTLPIQRESLNTLNTPDTTIERPRKSSTAGPIGEPVIRENQHSFSPRQELYDEHSFFTNYFFGHASSSHDDRCTSKRRISYGNTNQNWKNGWTALSDTVHEKLFRDVIADRSSVILSRAKEAYLRLNKLSESKFRIIPSHQTLHNLREMMKNIHLDYFAIDSLELYETLNNSKASEFECVYDQQQGYIVRLTTLEPKPSSIPTLIPSSPTTLAFDNTNNTQNGIF